MSCEIEGIVIDSIDYKETSKIVKLYTKYGYDSIKVVGAKNIKKGLLGIQTTLNVVSYIKSNSSLPTLIEFNLIDSSFSLTTNIKALGAVELLLRVLKSLPEDIDHERVYSLALKTIDSLKRDINPDKVISVFLIKMLYVYGVNPNLRECVRCGSNINLSFDIHEGGCVCTSCKPSRSNTYHIWYEYYYKKCDFKDYTDTNFDVLLREIKEYYRAYTHIL